MRNKIDQEQANSGTMTSRKPANLKLLAKAKKVINEQEELIKKNILAVWGDLPEWQKDNEYIVSGYVRETNNYVHSFKSLFYLHNESVNIYTHLLPGIILLGLVMFSLNEFIVPVFATTSKTDYAMFNLFFSGAFFCLLMSSTFHCFKSHSEHIAIVGNKLDYLGIVALIVASMISIMHYGFHDSRVFFYLFSTLTLLLGTACAVVSLDGKFRSREWRAIRAGLFVGFGLSAVFPIVGGIFVYGLDETYIRIGLKWVILEGVFYITGAALYGLRLPEKLSPGKFDMYGHSHQIFHVLVVFGVLAHLKGLLEAYCNMHAKL